MHAGSLRHNTSISNINGKTQTHNRKCKNTHKSNKYTIAPRYTQLTISIDCKNYYCSINLWICKQSHPNIPLSITFLLYLLPLNRLRSPIFHPSFFAASTSQNHDCLCSHIPTLHSSHSTTLPCVSVRVYTAPKLSALLQS